MKTEDLPTPEALEELLKEFIAKNAAEKTQEQSRKDMEEPHTTKDLLEDKDDDFEDLYDPYDGFKGLDDDFDLAYEALEQNIESESNDNDKKVYVDGDEEMDMISDYDTENQDNNERDWDKPIVTDYNDSESESETASDLNSDSNDASDTEDDVRDMDDQEFERLYQDFLHDEDESSSEEDDDYDEDDDVDLDVDPLEQLMALTGLEDVKKAVQQQLYFSRIMKLRKEAGKKVPRRLMHLLLTGNPGTGKTTVAKLIGRIYKKEGILRRGHLVEASRATLVGEYLGQTEKKTLEAVEEAKDGILFIDEIYSLAEHPSEQSETKDYGFKVLDTLMPILDKVDSDLVVIGAGYPNKVRNFLNTNPGLTSRFPTVLYFQDFTVVELKEIALNILKKYDFTPTEEFLKGLDSLLKEAIKIKDHGNARMVNTLINNYVIPNLCSRFAQSEKPISDIEQTSLVLVKDLPTIEQLFPLAVKKRQLGFS